VERCRGCGYRCGVGGGGGGGEWGKGVLGGGEYVTSFHSQRQDVKRKTSPTPLRRFRPTDRQVLDVSFTGESEKPARGLLDSTASVGHTGDNRASRSSAKACLLQFSSLSHRYRLLPIVDMGTSCATSPGRSTGVTKMSPSTEANPERLFVHGPFCRAQLAALVSLMIAT